MLRPPLPLRTPGLLKLSMPSGVIIALTAGIGAAADAATGAAATTDRVTTMDRATDLTVGTGGDVVVAIGGVVTTGETDPVAAHARHHSRLQSGVQELMIEGGESRPSLPAGGQSKAGQHRADAVAAEYFTVSPGAQLRYTRRASPFLRGTLAAGTPSQPPKRYGGVLSCLRASRIQPKRSTELTARHKSSTALAALS